MVKYGHYFGLALAGAGVSPFPVKQGDKACLR